MLCSLICLQICSEVCDAAKSLMRVIWMDRGPGYAWSQLGPKTDCANHKITTASVHFSDVS
jgi:hypothetical protein